MDTLTLLNPVANAARPSRTAAALKSLMQFYEQGEGLEEDEDEIGLMVMLSGMVGGEAHLLGGD